MLACGGLAWPSLSVESRFIESRASSNRRAPDSGRPDPSPEELDAGLLVWKIHQRINRELLPESRTVVEFDFSGPRGRRVWLVLEPREVSVCVTPPGFDADLIVHADLLLFYRVWLGHVDYDTAIRCRTLVVDGPPSLARAFPRWLMWSVMARFVREHARAH